MDNPAISARVESLREEITIIRKREEITIIRNQELLYQRRSHHCYEEIRAHARRELRLLDIQTALRRLLGDEPSPKTTVMRIRNSKAHHMKQRNDHGPEDNSVAQP
jgi:hypothetical protein